MIQSSEDRYKARLMEMWKLCFHDTDEFIRFYFDEVYRHDEVLVLIEKEEPVAALQIIPYKMKLRGEIVNAGYISGAMTHPDHRRKGLMEQLLYFSFEEMKRKGMQLSFLIPQEEWLFDFYAKYNYRKAFPLFTEDVCLTALPEKSEASVRVYSRQSSLNTDNLYEMYFRLLSKQEQVVLKTRQQFEIILNELFLGKGKIFVPESGEGIAFTLLWKGEVCIKELLFENELVKQDILSSICCEYKSPTAKIALRNLSDNSSLYGMVKIIDERISSEFVPGNIYMSMMLD